MRIRELEKKTGLTRDTIRYYERVGLISRPTRESNGFRIYSKQNIKELNFIKMSQDIGFTLAEIKPGIEALVSTGKYCKNVLKQLNDQKTLLKNRIEKDRQSIKKIDNIIKSIKIS